MGFIAGGRQSPHILSRLEVVSWWLLAQGKTYQNSIATIEGGQRKSELASEEIQKRHRGMLHEVELDFVDEELTS
jgi:hypothetical protein